MQIIYLFAIRLLRSIVHLRWHVRYLVGAHRFRPGLRDIGSLFMPDRFHEPDTENAPKCGCLHKELYRIQEQSISDSYGAV